MNSVALPDRLRYVRQLVGVFVMAAALVLISAIVLSPQAGHFFVRSERLSIHLPPEGALGLRNGADVQVMGTIVGSVDQIRVNEEGDMEAQVTVRGNFGRFIRSDSAAIIRKPLGIGDAMIEITRGHGASLPANNPALVATADKAPSELIDETLRDFREQVLPVMRELRATISTYGELASDLRQRQAQFGQTLDHANAIADSVENGKGVASLILKDPSLTEDLRSVGSGLKTSIVRLQAELDQTSPTVQALNRSIGQLPELMMQTQETLRQVQRLSEAAQRSWLVGKPTQPADEGGSDLHVVPSGGSR